MSQISDIILSMRIVNLFSTHIRKRGLGGKITQVPVSGENIYGEQYNWKYIIDIGKKHVLTLHVLDNCSRHHRSIDIMVSGWCDYSHPTCVVITHNDSMIHIIKNIDELISIVTTCEHRQDSAVKLC